MEGKEDLKCVKPEACPWKIVLIIGRVNLREEDSVPAQNKFFLSETCWAMQHVQLSMHQTLQCKWY